MRSSVDFLGSQNSFLGYIYIFLFYEKYKLREISMLTSSNFQLFLSNYVTFDGCPRTFELFPVICCLED
jgi:hypothetical protein